MRVSDEPFQKIQRMQGLIDEHSAPFRLFLAAPVTRGVISGVPVPDYRTVGTRNFFAPKIVPNEYIRLIIAILMTDAQLPARASFRV